MATRRKAPPPAAPSAADPVLKTEQPVAPIPALDLPGVVIRTTADLTAELVASSQTTWAWLPGLLQALPPYTDDVDRDFGTDIWWQIARDPFVQSGVRLIVLAALAVTMQIPPTVLGEQVDAENPEFAAAKRVSDMVRANFALLRKPLTATLAEAAYEALVTGSALLEQVYEVGSLNPGDAPLLLLAKLKAKPKESYALVVDYVNNLLGVQYAIPGQILPLQAALVPDDSGQIPRFLSRERFLHLPWHPLHDNPLGNSHLRAAYFAWWFKRQLIPEYKMWTATMASPPIWFEVPPTATDITVRDPATGISTTVPINKALVDAGEQMRNGAVGAGQAKPHLVNATGGAGVGDPFLHAFEWANHEITQALLYQVRATMEAKHGSKADSGQGQDVLDLVVTGVQKWLADTVRADVVAPLVEYNFGPGAARYLPLIKLASTTPANFPLVAAAMANLEAAGYLHPSMYPVTDAAMGWSGARDMVAQQADVELERQALKQAAVAQPGALAATTSKVVDRRRGRQIGGSLGAEATG